jgi:hypothetical protein
VTTPPFRNDAGFYETPYGSFRSVTTIIDLGVPKGEVLRRWAASETAKSAFERLPYLIGASRDEEERKHAMTWLRNASERKRNQAADLGTAIHNAAEARVLGTPWPDPTEEEAPFLWAWDNFCRDWQPEWEAVELVVANPDEGYAGKTDWHAYVNIPDVGRVLCIGDYKTGKNIYPEIGLQLAAYRRAKVAWLRDGTEVVPPRADYAVGIHLRPDRYKRTGYRVLPVRTDDVVFEAFRHAIHVANFTADIAPTVVGKAISPAA